MTATIIPFRPRRPTSTAQDSAIAAVMGGFVAWVLARGEIRNLPFTRTNVDLVCARYSLSESSIGSLVREEQQYRTLLDC